MKYLILLLWLLPFFTQAQTAHIDDGRVAYRERITVNGVNRQELYRRAGAALSSLNLKADSTDEQSGLLVVRDRMRLTGMHSLRNFMSYELRLQVEDGAYEYRIDSIVWITDPRGEELIVTPSKKLVDNMEVTGPTAAKTEKQLNEIDMRLQKLIALLNKAMRKPD